MLDARELNPTRPWVTHQTTFPCSAPLHSIAPSRVHTCLLLAGRAQSKDRLLSRNLRGRDRQVPRPWVWPFLRAWSSVTAKASSTTRVRTYALLPASVSCSRLLSLIYPWPSTVNDREERTTRPPFRILKEFEADGVTPKVDSKKEEIFIMKNNAQGEQVYQYDVLHDERRLAAAASSGVADPAPVASTPSPSSSRRPYHDSSHLTGTGDSPLSEPEPSPEPTSVALPIPKSPQNRRRTRGSGNDNLHPPPPPPAAPTAESAALWMSASASSSNKFRTKRSRSEAAAEAIDAKDEAAPDASKSESARLRGCVDEAPVSDVPSTDAPATSSSLGSETIKSISSV